MAGQPSFPKGFFCLGIEVARGFKFSFKVSPKHYVSAPSGHVSRNGDHSGAPCLSNDFCLLGMVLCVQHFVLNSALFKPNRELL